jgi:hypothetical protein
VRLLASTAQLLMSDFLLICEYSPCYDSKNNTDNFSGTLETSRVLVMSLSVLSKMPRRLTKQ